MANEKEKSSSRSPLQNHAEEGKKKAKKKSEKAKKEQTQKPFAYDTSYTQNRELSWLQFNYRVLEEALDGNVPLLERLKFLSIFTSNLDEFFMVRVGSLYDLSMIKQPHIDNKTGLSAQEQLRAIFKAVSPLYKKRDKAFFDLQSLLKKQGIVHIGLANASGKVKKFAEEYFKTYVQPVLSPQVIDPHHPFPHMVNNMLYVAVLLKDGEKEYYGIVPIPEILPEVIYTPFEGTQYLLIEELICAYIDRVFSMYQVRQRAIISVTRNADINPDDEQFDVDDDYRVHMAKVLKKRARLAPVRMQVQGEASARFIDYFTRQIGLKKDQVFHSKAPLKLAFVYSLIDRIPKETVQELTYPPFQPVWPGTLSRKEPMIRQIMRRDILLFYPYESMEPFLQLIKEAAEDPAVVSIKITIYRLASQSKLIEYLLRAVENHKEVTVLMELRARFDEENNINWSGELEDAGCQVIYGFEGYKVHSKICLITRREHGKIQYITQIGTGNYNEKTAKLYTDLSFMTDDPEIGNDAAAFFQNMAISNLKGEYHHLLVAPHDLKREIIARIKEEEEKGPDGYIVMKMNSLTDRDIIDALQSASCRGVPIHLIVRGICCLLPQVPGKTEHVDVVSVVGRFLEHPRIYAFGNDIEKMKIYIGSADMMTRNTQRRVEILTPIYDLNMKRKLMEWLDIMRKDTIKARQLQADGSYKRMPFTGAIAIDSQAYLMNLAYSRAQQAGEKKTGFFRRLLAAFKFSPHLDIH